MIDERCAHVMNGTGRERGGMLLEALVAVVILTIAFLAWSGSMMGASQGQYHAAKHTESIEIANYYLEQIRRDPQFWSSAEWAGAGCTQTNCWSQPNPPEPDPCGTPYPAYADAGPQNGGTWHQGCQNLTMESGGTINEPYSFQWRADIHCKGGCSGGAAQDNNTADITVWVQTQELHGGLDVYKVTGLKKAPQS